MGPGHPDHVEGWQGSIEDLAIAIASMRYDRVADFLGYLTGELMRQSSGDMKRGRNRLSTLLYKCASKMSETRHTMDQVWKLCAPHMTNNSDDQS